MQSARGTLNPVFNAGEKIMDNPPELGEFVVATVKKVMPYGAFCSLDEYGELDSFVHVSEVSSGWIRNIREHVKEGQKIVAKVINVNAEKRQIDLSLKRVSESDRKKKLESFQSEKRAVKLLERAANKLGKKMDEARKEVLEPAINEYGELFAVFEALSAKEELKIKIPKNWLTVLEEIAVQEIKKKQLTVRYSLKMQTYASNGVEKIKEAAERIEKTSTPEAITTVHYLGSAKYYVDVTSHDYKVAEKAMKKVEAVLEEAEKEGMETELEQMKQAN